MKEITFEKLGKTKNIFPIAAGFLLLSNVVYAQNAEQLKKIKEASNQRGLSVLQKKIKKSSLTVKQLQKKAKQLKIPFVGKTSKGKLFQLQGFNKKGRPMYYITDNVDAAEGTGTDKIGSGTIFNLEGENMKVHEWDGGSVRVSHQEFGGRVEQKDGTSGLSAHATHVAGTMVASGVNPQAKGMAPKARLDAYDWTDDEVEMIEAARNGAILSNHSYGYTGGFAWGDWSGNEGWHWLGDDDDIVFKGWGQYLEPDRDWDLITTTAPFYLPIKAAGNPRGDGPELGGVHYYYDVNTQTWVRSTKVREKNGGDQGFDSVLYGSTGKNILVVGAAEKIPGGYKQPSDVKMASFSGFGPTDDGRIKPDISGVGVDIVSSVTLGDAAYGVMSGTSMASPNVTGSLLLLQEQYSRLYGTHMKSATVKALAIATANEAGENPGPDYKAGWGLLNALEAAQTVATRNQYSLIQEETLNNNETKEISVVASGNGPLKVTIAWVDPVPTRLTDETQLNDRTAMLVNDLDVRVLKDGVETLPWRLNPDNPSAGAVKADNTVDNVEQVVVENPEEGATYTIRVTHKGTLQENDFVTVNGEAQVQLKDATSQDYSLVVTGINSNVTKDLAVKQIEVKAQPKDYTNATPVEVVVENIGKVDVSSARLNYKLVNADNENEVVAQGYKDLADIKSKGNQKVTFDLDLSKSFTNYIISVEVAFSGDEVEVNNSTTKKVYGILADLTPEESAHSFDFETDLAKNGWSVEDTDANGGTWFEYIDPELAYEGAGFAVNFPAGSTGVSDWLFSNPLKLKANTLYKVSFYGRKFQNLEESISISLGNEPNSTAMTQEIAAKVDASKDGEYRKYVYEFSVPTDQVAYVGFHHKTKGTDKAYAFGLDNAEFAHAEAAPEVDFKSNKTQVNAYEVVNFSNSSYSASSLPAATWEWVFSPASVEYQENTDKNSKEPKVRFTQDGEYTVTLKAKNTKGETELTKDNYIVVNTQPAQADFTVSARNIVEREAVVFTNTSTGNPKPTEYQWTITPTDGVEYVSGTSDTSVNPNVKFNKPGKYSVSLLAKSIHNEDTKTETDYINVDGVYNKVRNLTYTIEKDTNDLTLKWDKPLMNPVYREDFELNGVMPADITVIDENGNQTWRVSRGGGSSGEYYAVSLSWWWLSRASFDANDWLITPKLRKGAEVLEYAVKNPYAERYDVYLVEAPESGEVPTVDEIKAGKKIASFDPADIHEEFKKEKFSIKNDTGKDFYVAFHHRTTAADDGLYIALDDIQVGYENDITPVPVTNNKSKALKDNVVRDEAYYKSLYQGKEKIALANFKEQEFGTPNSNKITFGVTSYPYLVGYQVLKDGVEVKDIQDIEERVYNEALTSNGSYTYDVYAVYSDGVKSEKESVTVQVTTLSTTDVTMERGVKVYPNPSTGRFVVEAPSDVAHLSAHVYDLSGKEVLSQTFKGHKFDLNLSHYPKGVYILHLVDNKGTKHNVKLMVK